MSGLGDERMSMMLGPVAAPEPESGILAAAATAPSQEPVGNVTLSTMAPYLIAAAAIVGSALFEGQLARAGPLKSAPWATSRS